MKGRFTFRFAAFCFGLSAVWELINLQDEALLFGHAFAGVVAAIYHLIYAALFGWLLVGMWQGRRSGYYALVATTIVYTVDRLQGLFVGNVLETLLREQLAGNAELTNIISVEEIMRTVTLTTLAMILCWWGFVAYAYYRREYFGIRPASDR